MEFSVDEDLFEQLIRSRHLNHFKVVRYIMKGGTVTHTNLVTYMQKSNKALNKILDDALMYDIIERFMEDDTGEIFYTIGRKYLIAARAKCRTCDWVKIKMNPIGDKKIKTLVCTLKKEGVTCVNDGLRNAYNVYKIISTQCRKSELVTLTRDHNVEVDMEKKKVSEWNINDFVRYVLKLNEEYFPELYIDRDQRYSLKKTLIEIKAKIKKIDAEKWQSVFKVFIYLEFLKAQKEGRGISWRYSTKGKNFIETMKKIGYSNAEVEFCKIQQVKCTYCIEAECSLGKDGQECTPKIVDHMRRNYA